MRDGWLHTGDIGVLDAGRLPAITDRKKDMIVLSGGENISPAQVEGLLIAAPEIAQAVVAGEGGRACRRWWCRARGWAMAGPAAVARVNKRLAVTERIRRHAVVAPFTIENGLLTATQKIRRHHVIATHAGAAAGPPA